jgi:hypothetical protein
MVPNRTVPRISLGLWQRTETESREVEREEHMVTRTVATPLRPKAEREKVADTRTGVPEEGAP